MEYTPLMQHRGRGGYTFDSNQAKEIDENFKLNDQKNLQQFDQPKGVGGSRSSVD